MDIKQFGSLPTGEMVDQITLTNFVGASVEIITYGGIVKSLSVPDRKGEFADVVMGFDALDGYLAGHLYFGAITGRVAGRIPFGRFTLDGVPYQLACNDGPHHLHGGVRGLDKRIWRAKPANRPDGAPSVDLHYRSPHGEEGYPGNLDITVTYTLTDANELVIESTATSDRPTPISLTNHAYFNLAGEGSGSIRDHELWIPAEIAIMQGEGFEPLGRTFAIAGTASDFNRPRRIGDAIPGLFGQHGDLYLVPRQASEEPVTAARLAHPASGRVLTVHTTERFLQFYTGAYIDCPQPGKSGVPYSAFAGVALECEGYSDGVNRPEFGDILVRPGIPQHRRTVYAFSTT
jgi:aldose 1-epimerase